MRYHFLSAPVDGPWGGGNQFLKALRKELIRQHAYTDQPVEGDVILFNSHHNLRSVVWAKVQSPRCIFIHRLDGPMSYRGRVGRSLDEKIFFFNRNLSDGTIFQSKWSQARSYEQGHIQSTFETIIPNAPDPEIFYSGTRAINDPRKIRLVSTAWSSAEEKGADVFQFLDNFLNFDKYEVSYVGRISGKYKNIRVLTPLTSKALGGFLRTQDIFVFASRYEACSNSLLEGLHCGLWVIALDSSSNAEVLSNRGELFSSKAELLVKIDKVANQLRNAASPPEPSRSINDVARSYIKFAETIAAAVTDGSYSFRRWAWLKTLPRLV